MDIRHKEALLQHEELMLVTDRISLIIGAPEGIVPENRFKKLLDYEIGFLTETLREHFLFEETGGYLSSTFASSPILAPQVEILRNEHAEMAAGLDVLKRHLAGMARHDITRKLQDLVQTLHRHECAENDLLEMLLCEEHEKK